jgi:hypothetical protein
LLFSPSLPATFTANPRRRIASPDRNENRKS